MSPQIKRHRISITGIVQGVGFRPTVYRYALEFNLTGTVNNCAQGVFIEVQGESKSVENFCLKLEKIPPPLALIDSFKIEIIPTEDETSFEIISSASTGDKDVLISPDIATCKNCISDILDPQNRRYRYAFTNCTDCGPRYTIIKDRPYDRPMTSMSEFPLCEQCQEEYDNPLDRRFHAQPNACETCGPKLSYIGKEETIDLIADTAEELKRGKIVAIKGLGGFNIACDPFHPEALGRLRKIKNRPTKSFALMVRDAETASKFAEVSEIERNLLNSIQAPIVLLRKNNSTLDHVAPETNTLGIMVAYTPLHHLLLKEIPVLIMTSANKQDEPIAIEDDQINKLIQENLIDFALTHNRPIINRADDSIVQVIDDEFQIIRRSRGYVPTPFVSNHNLRKAITYGANLKNTFALTSGNRIFASQHIGDLMDVRNYDYCHEQSSKLKGLLEIEPVCTITDAHPNYENHARGDVHVFHHHAHMLSAMVEHNLLGKKILGIVYDGTGYGTDQTIWGGEFLYCDQNVKEFKRVAHLSPFPLIGGERAICEVNRIGYALSRHLNIASNKIFDELVEQDINCPQTSSMGRLFDGVSSILGICHKVEYEAQAAILLQQLAERCSTRPSSYYDIDISENRIVTETLIQQIIEDVDQKISIEQISYKFHLWCSRMTVEMILELTKEIELDAIVLSGGCFINSLLYKLTKEALKGVDIPSYFNQQVPTGDGGISIGQAAFMIQE